VTIAEWLASREPAPPRDLADRVREVLGPSLTRDAEHIVIACLDAADTLLASLRDDPDAKRERALDLLAVDALVTYAFEAGAEHPETLAELARGAMWRVGEVAAELEP
jgi:hypothetical protein